MQRITLFLLLGFFSPALAVTAPQLYQDFEHTLLTRYVNPKQQDLQGLLDQHRQEVQEACNTTPGCPSSAAYPAIRAVMQSLKDGHANFLTPQQAQNFRDSSTGSSTGFFGLQSTKLADGRLLVQDVVKGGPADLAGLARFDVISGLDTTQTEHPQTLEVTRLGQPAFQKVITPQKIPLVFMPYLTRRENLGILRIPTFLGSDQIANTVHQLVARAQAEGMEGMVVDLRSNGGGRSDQCLLAALAFNPQFTEQWMHVGWKHSVVAERGQLKFKLPGGAPIPLLSLSEFTFWNKPAIFLVNGRSASCAEFMAFEGRKGPLTRVYGESTYGVGNTSTVLYDLKDGSALQLSILYVTNETGEPYPDRVVPDVPLTDDPERLVQGEDPVLQRALQDLQNNIR